MKLVALTAAITAAASTVFAGNIIPLVAPPAPEMIDGAGPMGGSGAWIIPLLAIALIALAMNSDDPA